MTAAESSAIHADEQTSIAIESDTRVGSDSGLLVLGTASLPGPSGLAPDRRGTMTTNTI